MRNLRLRIIRLRKTAKLGRRSPWLLRPIRSSRCGLLIINDSQRLNLYDYGHTDNPVKFHPTPNPSDRDFVQSENSV